MTSIPDLHELFQHVDIAYPVIAAVSGGSDSLALLHLASSWASQHNVDLNIVTVDHGLRPEAAAEAAFVAGICEGLHLRHVTLAWEGIKPVSGVSEAAREARYLLISEFAKDIGARTILTGHTCDDQAETVWMRNSRGRDNPQFRGLSGMANAMLLPSGIRVERPLLQLERSALRDYLKTLGQPWIEDPSNEDLSYERVRARQALAVSDISVAEISRFAQLAGRQRKLICQATASLLMRNLRVHDGPVFTIAEGFASEAGKVSSLLAIQVLVAFAGGRNHMISFEMAEQILALQPGQKITAGYAVAECLRTGFRFYRENRNHDVIEIMPGKQIVWDNRLQIDNRSDRSFTCGVLSQSELLALEGQWQFKLAASPRAALFSTPVLVRDDGELQFPFLTGLACEPGMSLKFKVPAIEDYCSEFDFALLEIVDSVCQQVGLKTMTRES